jgi:hypothetical protein
MFESVGRGVRRLISAFSSSQGSTGQGTEPMQITSTSLRIIRKGPAMRVIFFYPGEEGTYVDHAEVTLYENCIVHISSNQEETTTHLQNCEILWRFETDAEDRANKVRLLKPKVESRSIEEPSVKSESPKPDGKPNKASLSINPDLID